MENFDKQLDELKKFEKENFAVKVDRARFVDDYIFISVTHNKTQWDSITLHGNDEVEAVILALQKYLNSSQ